MKSPELGPKEFKFEIINITGQDRILTDGPKHDLGVEGSDNLKKGRARATIDNLGGKFTNEAKSIFL